MDGDNKQRARRSYADITSAHRRQVRPPAGTDTQVNAVPIVENAKPKKTSRKKGLILTTLLAVLVAAGVGSFIYLHKNKTPLDNYAKGYAFSLYYPSSMPGDYTLAKSSVKPSATILLYSLSNSSEQSTIVLTLQAAPSGFDATKLTGKNSAPLSVPVGTLYNLSVGDQSKYMLATSGGTLIFINAATNIDTEVVNSLATRLQKVE